MSSIAYQSKFDCSQFHVIRNEFLPLRRSMPASVHQHACMATSSAAIDTVDFTIVECQSFTIGQMM